MMHDLDRQRSGADQVPEPPRVRVGRTFAVVGAIHAVAAVLLLIGVG